MSDSPKHPADPANELASDNSAIDPRDFRNALSTFATGVTIVTAMAADGTPYGVTCNSFASVSLNPPLVLWSLGMFSQGLTIFQNASHFTVNVPGAPQRTGARRQRRQFSVSCRQSLLWWRPRYYPGGCGGLCLQSARAAVVCERRLRPVHLGRRQKVVVTGEHRSALKPMYLSRSPARFVALEGDVTG